VDTVHAVSHHLDVSVETLAVALVQDEQYELHTVLLLKGEEFVDEALERRALHRLRLAIRKVHQGEWRLTNLNAGNLHESCKVLDRLHADDIFGTVVEVHEAPAIDHLAWLDHLAL
jgi:hypothetical protein